MQVIQKRIFKLSTLKDFIARIFILIEVQFEILHENILNPKNKCT